MKNILLALTLTVSFTSVNAATTYKLNSHPGGNQNPPPYGLRLDGLFGTNSHEYTFDFDHAQSSIFLTLDGDEITISGQVYGGEDNGMGYGQNNTGLYEIDFTYTGLTSIGNGGVKLTGDMKTTSSDGTGTIKYSGSDGSFGTADDITFDLLAQSDNSGLFFEFAPDGHRLSGDSSTWVGRGWVNHGNSSVGTSTGDHVVSSDWIFTAERVSDGGSTIALFGIALTGFGFIRRTRK